MILTKIAAAASFIMAAQIVQAEELIRANASFAVYTGNAERIESADRLRTYSQEVAAAACFYHNGIDPDLSYVLLQEARTGFDMHLSALMYGNAGLGIIGGEERRKTIVRLEEIEAYWGGMAQSVDALMVSAEDKVAVNVIKDQNLQLLEMTSILVSEVEGQYSDPADLMQLDVLTLEIAGRQAMMTQKIAKNACKLWSGRDTVEIRENLEKAINIYEISLNALLNGMPEAGLMAAPNDEIAGVLGELIADWAEIRPVVDGIVTGATTEEDLSNLFQHMADEMHKLEDLTHQYVAYSKR